MGGSDLRCAVFPVESTHLVHLDQSLWGREWTCRRAHEEKVYLKCPTYPLPRLLPYPFRRPFLGSSEILPRPPCPNRKFDHDNPVSTSISCGQIGHLILIVGVSKRTYKVYFKDRTRPRVFVTTRPSVREVTLFLRDETS